MGKTILQRRIPWQPRLFPCLTTMFFTMYERTGKLGFLDL
jgi:hypothetical protein